MKKILKTFIKKILRENFGIAIATTSELERLRKDSAELVERLNEPRDLDLLQRLNRNGSNDLLHYFKYSKSQLRQDLFVLSEVAFKKNGYFVEFGAANGCNLSNTYLMEKELGWSGILAEPATIWHDELKNNRNCHIETSCVWKDSDSVLMFNQVQVAELSTISNYSESDLHGDVRKVGEIYKVKTISLNDLLSKYNAPENIDYLSIDTEGSEYEILSNFDFSKHTFGVITCEHNYTPMREKLYTLLTLNGYKRVFEDLSLFDDWYVKTNVDHIQ